MIGIELEGDTEYLETKPDTTINIRLENPILSDDDKLSPGSYSLPFDLPGGEKSPSNAAKLKNPDVIENNEAYEIQKAKLFYGGVPFKAGILKSTGANPDTISNYFKFGLNSISEEFKTKKLRDLVALPMVISNTPITKKIFVKRATGDYSITVNGKNYSGSANGVKNLINADADAALDTGKYMPLATEVTVGTSPSGSISATFLEIKLSIYFTFHDTVLGMDFLLRNDSVDPLHELSVTVDTPSEYEVESFDMDTYYDEFDSFLEDYPSDKLVFTLMFNANPFGEVVKVTEFVNAVNASGGIMRNDPNWGLNHGEPLVTKSFNSLQPFLLLKWVLDKIADEYGFEWEGDFYEHPDFPGMVVDNNSALDVAQEFIGTRKFVFWRRSFNVSDLVPDLKVPEFLTYLKGRYNLAIYQNDETQKVRICFREPLAKANTYDDITRISSPIDGNEDERVTGFTLSIAKEEYDAFSFAESVTVGSPEEDIPIKCGRLFNTKVDLIEDGVVSGPYVSRKWGERFGFRIFHYHGIEDNGEFEYQKADIHGSIIIEQLSTFIVVGLYDTFFKYWLHFRAKRKGIKLKVDWPFRLLRNFKWDEKKRFNRSNYFVKAIDVEITNQRVKVKSVELKTMQ